MRARLIYVASMTRCAPPMWPCVRAAHPGCDLRTAAYMVAIRRIASVMDLYTL